MKKEKLLSLFFAGALGAGLLWNVLTPDRAYSESENRYLASFPEVTADNVFSGRFTEDFGEYVSDQFPGREGWVALKTMTQLMTLRPDNGRVYFGQDSRLFAVPDPEDASLMERNCRAVADFLTRVRETWPETRVSVLLAPTASTLLSEDLPLLAPVQDEEALMDRMREALGDIPFCDPTQSLLQAPDREALYYRTDHHWTAYGALTACTAWLRELGLEPLDAASLRLETVSDSFYGTLYSKANLPWIPADTLTAPQLAASQEITVSYSDSDEVLSGLYDPSYLEGRDQYSYYLGGNHPLTTVETGAGTGRSLLVVKDSYAHAFVPYLTGHYDTIVLLDPRYFREDILTWMEGKGFTDVLVLYNAATFSTDRQMAAVLG